MLSFAEEIYLIALDDVSGELTIPANELDAALVGAVIGELCFLNRLDNDTESIYLLDDSPSGSEMLDEILSRLKKVCQDKSGEHPKASIHECLRALLPDSEALQNRVLKELLDKGVLKQVDEKILWIFPSHRYPVINGREIQDVESRLRDLVVNGDEIPEPRETVLVSLVHACGLFEQILSPKELKRFSDRIINISKTDSVGVEVSRLIDQLIAMTAMPPYN